MGAKARAARMNVTSAGSSEERSLISKVSKVVRESFRRKRISSAKGHENEDHFANVMDMLGDIEESDFDDHWKVAGSGCRQSKCNRKSRRRSAQQKLALANYLHHV
jgi:hypothetical protein